MTLKLAIENAPAILAGLVREGVQFDAQQKGATIVITFTGGF
jgi:hypothetical protein